MDDVTFLAFFRSPILLCTFRIGDYVVYVILAIARAIAPTVGI